MVKYVCAFIFEILLDYSDYVTFTAGVIRCLIMFEPKLGWTWSERITMNF